MASNRRFNFGPVALGNGVYTTNILNPCASGVGSPVGYTQPATRITIRHIHVYNTTGGALTFRLYKGATGANVAGTEFFAKDQQVLANADFDRYGEWIFDVADFLVGGGSATGLTIEGEGEIGLV